MEPVKLFIGYDSRETVAYHVLSHSIMTRSSVPVSITGLLLSQLPLTRAREGSTDFAFSRFLVPWLCGYKGKAVFMDCDMLCRADISELIQATNGKAVSVVQHDYSPRRETKFLGNVQTTYARKNWSSVMVFNCEQCPILTPEVVNNETGLYLHQLKWLRDIQVGSVPRDWNHLVGEYPENPGAKLAHFTNGIPAFKGYEDCEFADEWRSELKHMNSWQEVN